MSSHSRDESPNSRTQSLGTKRSASNNSRSSRKRRRNNAHNANTDDLVPSDNSFSALSQPHDQAISDEMASQNLGRNRLMTGFKKPNTARQESKSSGEMASNSEVDQMPGESSASPIEISDDEMEGSEGGMVINVDNQDTNVQIFSSDDSSSEESGEIVSTPENSAAMNAEVSDLFTIDPTSNIPLKRLIDLSNEELEDQLKYAFYHLDRDRIDLNRPVMCLTCATEGHVYGECGQDTTDVFPVYKVDSNVPVRLWVSCCLCASKSHLVGDCPQAHDKPAARWSLKGVDSEQIINLSLETGTAKLEKDARNNGIRPKGLQIKGRASLHNAGVSRADSSDEGDEPFLRKPVGKMPPSNRQPVHQRFDRYDPPTERQTHRGGGHWYQTDSFGRRRSRSPEAPRDTYRPRDDYTRSRYSPQPDNWRPPPDNYQQRDSYRNRQSSPRRENAGRAPTSAQRGPRNGAQGSNVHFSLPTRKGSNTWNSGGQSGTSTPSSTGKPGDNHQPRRKRNPNHNRKKGVKNK